MNYRILAALILVLLVGVAGVGALPTANFTINQSSTVGIIQFDDNSDVKQVTNTSWLFSNSDTQPQLNVPFPPGWSWTDAPINIYKNGTTYSTDFDVTNYLYTGTAGKTYYVNQSSGSDFNTGLSWAQAFQTPRKAMDKSDVDIIYIGDGEYPTDNITYSLARNMSVIGVGNVTLTGFYNTSSTGAFSLESGYTKTYNATRNAVNQVWDAAYLDSNNYYRNYTMQYTIAGVESNDGSWNLTGSFLYVHPLGDRAPDASVKISASHVSLGQTVGRTLYVENIKFFGGTGVIAFAKSDGSYGYFYGKNDTFSYAWGSNGLESWGVYSYTQNCTAYKNYNDAFSYKAQSGAITHAIEVDNTGMFGGVTGDADNGSTGHTGSLIIRINGIYHDTKGPVVHDISDGTQSWNINSWAYNSTSTLYNSAWKTSTGAAKTWYYGCNSSGTSESLTVADAANAVVSEPNFIKVSGNNITLSEMEIRLFSTPGTYTINHSVTNSTGTSWRNQTMNVSQFTSNTTTKLNYITISALSLPTPNFNATPRYLTPIPQSVVFNFTGQNPHPVSYVWDFGDGSTTTIFAPANPNTTHIYAASGSYTVTMTATNTLGTITETKTDYISVSEPTMSIVPTPRNISYLVPAPVQVRVSGIRHADAIIGNFTYNQSAINVTQVNLNTSALSGSSLSSVYTSGYVSFNLTKPDQNYIAPTDIVDIWFNAINVNNGTEPINYDLAFPMSNGVLSNSSFTVAFYNYTTKTEGSITLENLTYTRKIKFVDSSTLNMINTQIVTSYWWGVASGNTATTDGYTTVSAKYGTLTINATADAYYPTQQNIIFNTNDDYTLYMTPLQSPGTQKLNVLYPREVQFKIVDAFGKPLPNVQTSARMVNSTVTGTNWVATLYGIPNAADDIETTGMVGITDDIGVVVFPMIATNQYGLLFTNSTSGIISSKLVSPKDTSYVIYIPLAGQAAKNNTIAQVATSSLPWYKLNTSYYNLSMIYHDTNGYTTDVVFNVWDYTAGGTLVYTKDWGNPGTTKIVDNYTVYLPLGQEFRWQYNATKV